MRTPTLILALSILLGGCLGDPDLGASSAPLDEAPTIDAVDRPTWERAAPGCEDVDLDGLRIAACDGETLLGALVSSHGVVCVDALSLLREEIAAHAPEAPTLADPTPTPALPLGHWYPTPTPVLE